MREEKPDSGKLKALAICNCVREGLSLKKEAASLVGILAEMKGQPL